MAFKAYEEFTVEMEESQMGFVRRVTKGQAAAGLSDVMSLVFVGLFPFCDGKVLGFVIHTPCSKIGTC